MEFFTYSADGPFSDILVAEPSDKYVRISFSDSNKTGDEVLEIKFSTDENASVSAEEFLTLGLPLPTGVNWSAGKLFLKHGDVVGLLDNDKNIFMSTVEGGADGMRISVMRATKKALKISREEDIASRQNI